MMDPMRQKPEQPPAEQLGSYLGRLYQMWPTDSYLFPADKKEQDRLDIYHQLFRVVLEDRFHTPGSRIDENSRVLDIGCGTGIWVMQLAFRLHPMKCLLVGLDVQMTQPDIVPESVRFTRADVEATWAGELAHYGPYDLINCRLMKGAIHSWPGLYKQVATHLTPGTGVFEHMEFDWHFRNDEGPVPPALKRWSTEVADAMDRHGTPIRIDPQGTRAALQAAGFVDVREDTVVIPISNWPEDRYGCEIGRWFNLALMQSILPMALAPLCRVAGRTREYVEDLDAAVQTELRSQTFTDNVYCRLYIWTAKVPRRG